MERRTKAKTTNSPAGSRVIAPQTLTATADTSAIDALLAEDAAATPIAPDTLARIREQAVLLDKLERDARELTQQAEECEKEARRIAETVLPQLMDEAGLPAIELDDDTRIERGEDVYASISAANAADATAWLEKNGYGAIVKFGFVIPVDKGDTKLADHIRGVLTKARIGYEEKGGVHAATLTAFVKEALTAGRPLPKSITHHVQPRVRVKKAKKKRAATGRTAAR